MNESRETRVLLAALKNTFTLLDTFHYIISLVYLPVQIKCTSNILQASPSLRVHSESLKLKVCFLPVWVQNSTNYVLFRGKGLDSAKFETAALTY